MFRNSSFSGSAILVPAAIVCMVALPGCGSKVTAENYAKIQPGQSEADVQAILGEPTKSETGGLLPGTVTKTWTDGSKTIAIVFINGKVVTSEKTGL